jgi:hypothetical protein
MLSSGAMLKNNPNNQHSIACGVRCAENFEYASVGME